MIICDANHAPIEQGRIFIGYCEMVDGYRHAWRETKHGRTKIRYSRTANHPTDPACPECNPLPEVKR